MQTWKGFAMGAFCINHGAAEGLDITNSRTLSGRGHDAFLCMTNNS
jgi:hypothetical protein